MNRLFEDIGSGNEELKDLCNALNSTAEEVLEKQTQAPMCKRHMSAEAKAILEERKIRYPHLSEAERKEYQQRIGHAAREDW